MSEDITFEDAGPIDPFTRVRYHYGMLLGAEDFSVEQREKLLRRRLHQALLHGAGTVWGLRVTHGDQDEDGLYTRPVVKAGIAVDALGRDLYVPTDLCLDVSGLAQNPIWAQLSPPPGAASGSTVRRAYVVMRYEACAARPVPAITPPCDEPGDAVAYSRALDRCRIDLAAAPPIDPSTLAREWLSTLLAGQTSRAPRDVLLDFLLDPPVPLERLWKMPADAPLLLATIDLDVQSGAGAKVFAVDAANNPDNGGRALLPPVAALADSLFGRRLAGPPLTPQAFQVLSWSVTSANQLRVHLTDAPSAAALGSKPIALWRLDATQWTDLTSTVSLSASGNDLVLDMPDPGLGATGTITYQIRVVGESTAPLVSQSGLPLAGLVGDSITHPRQGRDVSVIDTWTHP